MLVEPSTFTVEPSGKDSGKGNDVGLGDCAKTDGMAISVSSLGVAVRANATTESLMRVFLECMIGTENDVRQERGAIHEQTNAITPNL